jgi:hypothetical protein
MKDLSKGRYGDWEIYYDYPGVWFYTHNSYDGPGDPRHGFCASIQECVVEIDLWEEENPE